MALKGNQKKLDKNNNNRIDAQDFKILKAEKAKGRGMGLQDEKVKPGKVMKAKRGDFMKRRMELAGVKSAPGTTAKSAMGKTFSGYQKVFQTGVSAGDKTKATSTIIGVKPKLPEASKSSKIARRALKAAQATSLGKKLLLPVAGAVAVSQYLKSKMKKKKDEPKKKMGGGMMMRPTNYAEGGDAQRSPTAAQARRMGQRKPKPGRRAGVPSLPGKDKKKKQMFVILGENKKYSGGQGGLERDADNNPYRYSYDADPFLKDKTIVRVTNKSVGGSVTVKTKLGRNKPTKMY
tara:strand:- start:164 stop:1036 length:873 start_codon:yes stop_codon:yes gene_type:complete